MSGWALYYKENNTFLILGHGLKNLLQSLLLVQGQWENETK